MAFFNNNHAVTSGYAAEPDTTNNIQKRGRHVRIFSAAGAVLFAAAFFALGALYASLFPFLSGSSTRVITSVLQTIKSHYFYYDTDTENSIITGAIKGIAAYLGDDYAYYYTKEEYESLQTQDSGTYIGIGIVIQEEQPGIFVIMNVYAETSAEKAGLLPDDIIIGINGVSSDGLSLANLTALVLCESGAENEITVKRTDEVLTFKVTASEVYTPYVHSKMLADAAGYIHISGFHGKVTEEVREALNSLSEQGMERLILDLRDNLGGGLSEVKEVADIFMPEGLVITSVKSRNGKETIYYTENEGLSLPIVILVNGSTASASELLAAAMHDNGLALLVGTKTYGKGIVQSFFELNGGENGALKFTTDAYYTPNGVCIQGEGITPDILVKPFENTVYTYVYELAAKDDAQLQAALELFGER